VGGALSQLVERDAHGRRGLPRVAECLGVVAAPFELGVEKQ
jgi:hypothetical protein